jgi:hypothetical protein
MSMPEMSAIDAFEELLSLFKRNHQGVEFRRLIHEFVDNRPVLGCIKIDDGSASGRGASHLMVSGEPSDHLLRCLAAARALDLKRQTLGGRKTHGDHPSMTG